jgi:hypothetical protein
MIHKEHIEIANTGITDFFIVVIIKIRKRIESTR